MPSAAVLCWAKMPFYCRDFQMDDYMRCVLGSKPPLFFCLWQILFVEPGDWR